MRRVASLRIIRESEMLSINSCAIVWNAVVIAHYRALSSLLPSYDVIGDYCELSPVIKSYEGYSENLQKEADLLVKSMNKNPNSGIYDYCRGSEQLA